VELNKELTKQIKLLYEDGTVRAQEIRYENSNEFCTSYERVGHPNENCPHKKSSFEKVWKPKNIQSSANVTNPSTSKEPSNQRENRSTSSSQETKENEWFLIKNEKAIREEQKSTSGIVEILKRTQEGTMTRIEANTDPNAPPEI